VNQLTVTITPLKCPWSSNQKILK